MIAKTRREARQQAAILERRRAFIEQWSRPIIKRAYIKAGEILANLYEQGGELRLEALKGEAQEPLQDALNQVYGRVADTMLAYAKGAVKSFPLLIERKTEEEDLGRVWDALILEFQTQAFEQSTIMINTLGEYALQSARDLVVEGEDLRDGPRVVARHIRQRVADIAPFKAEMIARTEVLAASSEAQNTFTEEIWDEVEDGPLYKEWMANRGKRTRDDHRKMDGEVVPQDQTFKLPNGDELRYPGDRRAKKVESVVNCRCSYASLPEELVAENDRVARTDRQETPPVQVVAPEPEKPLPQMTSNGVEVGFDKSPAEMEWHEKGKWNKNADPLVLNALKKSKPLNEVLTLENTGSKYYRKTQNINMQPGASDQAGIWRHEFGHHIDFSTGNKTKLGTAVEKQAKKDAKVINAAIPPEGENAHIKKFQELLPLTKEELMERAREKMGGLQKDIYEYTTDRDFFFDLNQLRPDDLRDVLAHMEDRHFGENKFDNLNGNGILSTIRRLGWENGVDLYEGNNSFLFITDFIENITYAKQGAGHGRKYYMNRDGDTIVRGQEESFANYVSGLGGDKPELARKIFTQIAPNTVKEFDKILEEA